MEPVDRFRDAPVRVAAAAAVAGEACRGDRRPPALEPPPSTLRRRCRLPDACSRSASRAPRSPSPGAATTARRARPPPPPRRPRPRRRRRRPPRPSPTSPSRRARHRRGWSSATCGSGDGPVARTGQQVTVQYVGVDFKSGEQFDASWDRGEPFLFQLGGRAGHPGLGRGHRGHAGRRPARAS